MSQNGKSEAQTITYVRNGGESPLKRWRLRKGLTQEQAAAHLDVHRITYIRLEGQTKAIGKELAGKVASVTGQKLGAVIDEYERKARKVAR